MSMKDTESNFQNCGGLRIVLLLISVEATCSYGFNGKILVTHPLLLRL